MKQNIKPPGKAGWVANNKNQGRKGPPHEQGGRTMKGEKYTWRELWEIWKVICGQALTQRGGRL